MTQTGRLVGAIKILEPTVEAGPQKFEDKIAMHPAGLRFSSGCPYEVYEAFSQQILLPAAQRHYSTPFWMGDFINQGDTIYGKKYSQIMALTNVDYGLARNCSYVCRNVKLENRREELPFSHHYAVAKLQPALQRRFLQMAIDGGLSKYQLNVEIDKEVPVQRMLMPARDFNDYVRGYQMRWPAVELDEKTLELMAHAYEAGKKAQKNTVKWVVDGRYVQIPRDAKGREMPRERPVFKTMPSAGGRG